MVTFAPSFPFSLSQMSKYLFTFRGLHYYFTVNNSYVKNKLKLLLFPLRHKVNGVLSVCVHPPVLACVYG